MWTTCLLVAIVIAHHGSLRYACGLLLQLWQGHLAISHTPGCTGSSTVAVCCNEAGANWMHLKCYESHARSFTSGISGLGVNPLLASLILWNYLARCQQGLFCSFVATLVCMIAVYKHKYFSHFMQPNLPCFVMALVAAVMTQLVASLTSV